MILPGAGAVLLAALAGGVAAVERKALVQSMLSRPIVLCTLVGWALGDPAGGLFVGAPLELLWSGAANLGAALPQHETAAGAAIAAAAVQAGAGDGVHAATACAAFALLAPIALLGRSLEALGERANEALVARAAVAVAEGFPERGLRLHLLGLVRPFVAVAALTAFCAAAIGPTLREALARAPDEVVRGLGWGWALIWAAGGACTVRAARLPRGAALAAGAAVAAAALWAATTVAP